MEKRLGIRKFRDGLTRNLDQVRRGARLTITDRGRPIAILLPYERNPDSRQEERLRTLLSLGHVAPAEKRFMVSPPLIKGLGPPPSRLISEERR